MARTADLHSFLAVNEPLGSDSLLGNWVCSRGFDALSFPSVEQITGVQKVLGAAAWTYVAVAMAALGSWLLPYPSVSQTRIAADRS